MPRKKPYSNKKKKQQLQEKRERKRVAQSYESDSKSFQEKCDATIQEGIDDCSTSSSSSSLDSMQQHIQKVHIQPNAAVKEGYDANRYRLHFKREQSAEIEKRKALARQPLMRLPETYLEVAIDDIYKPGSVLDMPKRPMWTYDMSKHQVESNEKSYFTDYMNNIHEKYSDEKLSYFEHNLETWRQLWRVLEISNLILIIADIRHPILHFPPALYDFVVKDMKKSLAIVFNKIDLVPAVTVLAWKRYFKEKYPNLHIIYFTGYPQDEDELQHNVGTLKLKTRRRRRKRQILNIVGSEQLIDICRSLFPTIDLSRWEESLRTENVSNQDHCAFESESDSETSEENIDTDAVVEEEVKDGILTIGLVGHPNVGKSSVLNGLVGKKVVSTSRTPGHTKHFQTIYLSPTVRLCDSPGLIFPSRVDKQLQILSGLYPISQVREPYTTVAYIGARIGLAKLLNVKHPECECESSSTIQNFDQPLYETAAYTACNNCNSVWSAWMICEAWANKNGFMTAKAARSDVYRAANHLLRLTTDGRICIYMRPPGYLAQIGEYNNEDIHVMKQLQQSRHINDLVPTESEGYEESNRIESSSEKSSEESDNLQVINTNRFTLLLNE